MNILDYQDIETIQNQLLKIPLPKQYQLKIPNQEELSSFADIQAQHLHSLIKIKQTDHLKKINIARYLKVHPLNEPNSVLHMLIFTIFATSFPPHIHNKNEQPNPNPNLELIKTLKCSFYSKDIKMHSIQNSRLKMEDQTAQTILVNFFTSITNYASMSKSNEQTLNFSLCLIQHNSFLSQILVCVLRFIFRQFQIEGADNCLQFMDNKEVIINCLQFLDVSYRNIDSLILFYQQKLFMSLQNNSLVFGQYRQQDEGGSSPEQTNKIPSMGNNSQTGPGRKKTAVGYNDVKLFSHLLMSSRSDLQQKTSPQETQQQTPHFNKQSIEFVFGRRKKDENDAGKNNQLKKQFAKLILGQQNQSDIGFDQQIKQFNSPASSGQGGYDLNSLQAKLNAVVDFSNNAAPRRNSANVTKQLAELLKDHSHVQVQVQSRSKSTQKQLTSHFKHQSPRTSNMVSIKNAPLTSHIVNPTKTSKHQQFKSQYDSDFLLPQSPPTRDANSKHQMSNPVKRGQCPCYPYRFCRNEVVSQTVNINLIVNANFSSKNMVNSPNKYKETKQERIPTFLKARIQKSNCAVGESQEKKSKNSQSRTNNLLKYNSRYKSRPDALQQFKHLSQIISHKSKQILQKRKQSKQGTNSGKKRGNPESTKKKLDMHHNQYKKTLDEAQLQYWKTTSNMFSPSHPQRFNSNLAKKQSQQYLREYEQIRSPQHQLLPTHMSPQYKRNNVQPMRQSKRSNMNSFDRNVANNEGQILYFQKPQYKYHGERRLI